MVKNGYESIKFNENVIPINDNSTQFICSGMQSYKHKFKEKTKERLSSIQSCIRTNDIDLWGDNSHFVFFKMIGCFSFGNINDYEKAITIWLNIVDELGIKLTSIHIHPNSDHKKYFINKNVNIIEDNECFWSDGDIGGYCSEFYVGDIEIGNLVNPMGDCVDVGFGLERIAKLLGETYHKTYDLEKFLQCVYKENIKPNNKGINYTVKKVMRLFIRNMENINIENFLFKEWIVEEKEKMNKSFIMGKRLVKRHYNKSYEWWFDTVGLLPTEVDIIKKL